MRMRKRKPNAPTLLNVIKGIGVQGPSFPPLQTEDMLMSMDESENYKKLRILRPKFSVFW